MALRDFFRGGRRERDEHPRYPLDPLSRQSWHEDSEARFGADANRDYEDQRRHFNDRWEKSYSGPGHGRFRDAGDAEYGGSSSNPFYGEHPLARAGSAYDSGYFGSKNGMPTTQWRRDADNEQFDDLVYGGRSLDPYYASTRGEFGGRGPRGYRRSDERIREDVCQCLTDDDHIDASEIEVTVSEREVTLTGTVTSRMQKRHAEDLVERLPGVRDVINSIRVVSDTQGTQSSGNQSTRLGGQIR
jgi:hypothetical protein